MNYSLLIAIFTISLAFDHHVYSQPDISQTLADPATFEFKDLDLDVEGYFHEVLKADTTCCRQVDYFFSIQYDRTGTVIHAAALADHSDCTTQLLTEAAYKIRWEARQNIGNKTLYLELNFDPTCKN